MDPIPFVFEPDGATPIVEAFEFKSRIITAETGKEQRARLREHSHGGMTFDVVAFGNEAHRLAAALYHDSPYAWAVPLWPWRQFITADVDPDSTTIPGDFSKRFYDEDGLAKYALLRASHEVYELVKVDPTIFDDTALWLSSPLVGSWPAGSMIFPVRVGRMSSGSVAAARLGDAGRKGHFEFEFSNVGPLWYGLEDPDYDVDFAYFVDEPEGSHETEEQHLRRIEILDGGLGDRDAVVFDKAPAIGLSIVWRLFSVPDVAVAMDWIAHRFGRAIPFWLPPWHVDFELAAPAAAAATEISIKTIGYTSRLFPGTGARRYLRLRKGSTVVDAIVNAAEDNGDGTETLTLTEELGADVDTDFRCGFRRFCRLDDDRISITWEGSDPPPGSQGFAEIVLPCRELPLEAPIV